MPTYDYTCSVCGHQTEVIHGIHDPGPRVCPQCGSVGTMRKAFVAPAVHFKGSGWAKKERSATAAPGKSKAAPSSGTPSEGSARSDSSATTPSGSSGTE